MFDLYKSVDSEGKTFEQYMKTYDASAWKHPSVTIDVVLMTQIAGEMYVLLTKRKSHPFVGCWSTPGTFVNYDESLDKAVERTISEKIGIDGESNNFWYRQLHTFGSPDRDPRDRVITTSYLSLVNSEKLHILLEKDKNADNTKSLALFKVKMRKVVENESKQMSIITLTNNEENLVIQYKIVETVKGNWIQTDSVLDESISNSELAGDHIKLIHNAMVYMENNSGNYGVLLNLLPELFSLGDVQKVYEDITGKRQIAGNFRLSLLKSGAVVDSKLTRMYRGRNVALYKANKFKLCGV